MNEETVAATLKVVKTGTSMTCSCPHCLALLVEGEKLVFEIEREDQESGKLHLSPLLNVFESSSTIDLAEGVELADLRCVSCKQSLGESEMKCGECGCRAARFLVKVDGEDVDFYICMRKGCHWHDVSQAARSRMILESVGFHRPDNQLIQSGTKLECFCPFCSGDLVEGDNLYVSLVSSTGDVGSLELSARLNDFRNACTVDLAKGDVAQDVRCPKCNTSLVDPERRCNLCAAPAAQFKVRTVGDDARIFVCMRRQCHWHHLDDEARAWTLEPD